MTRKRPYPKEPTTKPGRRKQAAQTALAAKVRASERETLPPPPEEPSIPPAQGTHSGVRPRPRTSIPAATVDEVTADLTKDPRREE
jgi:hypothetical protein